MKYRKKPVVIDAIEHSGELTDALVEFLGGEAERNLGWSFGAGKLYIHTLEGVMTAQPGDYIIRGVKDELYPVKPDIFAATYETA